ncbi:MAG: hypothetical protein IIC03_06490 [Proteobacteria bacterium]|nr:hypothetical protein [Pseudomonadota bacterium]
MNIQNGTPATALRRRMQESTARYVSTGRDTPFKLISPTFSQRILSFTIA